MSRTPEPAPTTADQAVTEAPTRAGAEQQLTLGETVATTVTGMAIGGAALWFLAPICFTC